MVRLDHLTVVAPDLAAGCAYVAAALGVAPGPGRVHPGMGSHNRLLALGPGVYLEVISADPAAAPVGRPRWFGLDRLRPGCGPRLAAWVASTGDINSVAAPELGEVLTMRRDAHRWQMTVRADGEPPWQGAAPLLIQRAPGADPVAAMPPTGLQFERLLVRHPAPDEVASLWRRLGLADRPAVAVVQGPECSLLAEVRTPSGLRTLGVAWDPCSPASP